MTSDLAAAVARSDGLRRVVCFGDESERRWTQCIRAHGADVCSSYEQAPNDGRPRVVLARGDDARVHSDREIIRQKARDDAEANERPPPVYPDGDAPDRRVVASRASQEWTMDVIDVRIPKKDARGLSESVPPSYLQQYKATSSTAIVVSDAPSGADEVRDWARLEAFLKRKELDAVLKDCGTEPSLARSKLEASVLKALTQASVAQVKTTHPQTWVACVRVISSGGCTQGPWVAPDVRRALARRATRGDEAKAVAAALRVLRLATNGDVRSCEAALDGSEDRFLQYPKRELAALLETSTKLEALRSIIKSSPKKRIVVLAAQPEALDLCEEALRDHALHVSKTPEDHDASSAEVRFRHKSASMFISTRAYAAYEPRTPPKADLLIIYDDDWLRSQRGAPATGSRACSRLLRNYRRRRSARRTLRRVWRRID